MGCTNAKSENGKKHPYSQTEQQGGNNNEKQIATTQQYQNLSQQYKLGSDGTINYQQFSELPSKILSGQYNTGDEQFDLMLQKQAEEIFKITSKNRQSQNDVNSKEVSDTLQRLDQILQSTDYFKQGDGGYKSLTVKQQLALQQKGQNLVLKPNTIGAQAAAKKDPNEIRIKQINEWAVKNACKKQLTKTRSKPCSDDGYFQHDQVNKSDKVWRWWDKYKGKSKDKYTGKMTEYTLGSYWYEWGGTTTQFIKGFKQQTNVKCGDCETVCDTCYNKLPKEIKAEIDDYIDD